MERKPKRTQQTYRIDVVAKALELLTAFDYRHRKWTVDEVARKLDLSRSRAYRILQTLVSYEFIAVDDRYQYTLGPAVGRLGLLARTASRLDRFVLDALHQLHHAFGETVNFAILDGSRLIYAEILESTHPFRMSETVGDVVPVAQTALGRAILATVPNPGRYIDADTLQALAPHLDRVRERGYAVDDEDAETGVRCVGIALRDFHDDVFGALSVSGPVHRLSDDIVAQVGHRLLTIANGLTRDDQDRVIDVAR